ncbi:MAG: hypothetical protein MJ188_06245 [Treponema sp.]|nr:hypothetical protein [Treponema sp.]
MGTGEVSKNLGSKKEYKFSASVVEEQIKFLGEKEITEFTIHDEAISRDKRRVLKILNLAAEFAPQVFISILIDASIIDKEILSAATNLFCAFDIPLVCRSKGGKLLFDKKFYANKARLLNDFGLVFGFQLSYADCPGDTLKSFMERLDFAIQQYPNHIDFPQTENSEMEETARISGIFSAKDIRFCRDVGFACRTFYSSGRAVPWFLSVLKPLRIYPSKFFADFAEWQRCNNCDFKSGFIPEAEKHCSLEKMQLLFLEQKYEEKNCDDLLTAASDLVKINGAMSRLAGENEESTIKTSYHPDDLFGPESMDLVYFAENVCMEECSVKIFAGEEGPDYLVI